MYKSTFVIMPDEANYLTPLVFGGAFFAKMDLFAAISVKQCLENNKAACRQAVTHKASVTWHKPTYVGDTIEMTAKIEVKDDKSLSIDISCVRLYKKDNDKVCDANFVFVTIDENVDTLSKPEKLPYTRHGL